MERGIGKVRIFQRGGRITVTQKPADGGDRLAAGERHRGVGVTEIVKANIRDTRISAHITPEVAERERGKVAFPAGGREHPGAAVGQPVQYPPRVRRQPDRARPRLAVAQVKPAFAIIRPSECQELGLATSSEKQKSHDRDQARLFLAPVAENTAQSPNFVMTQESLAIAPSIAPDAGAGIGILRTIAVGLDLTEDHRENRRRTIRGNGRSMERGKPALDIPARDVRYGAAFEPRQDLVPVVVQVDLQRTRLPVPLVAPEDLVCGILEQHGCSGAGKSDVLLGP